MTLYDQKLLAFSSLVVLLIVCFAAQRCEAEQRCEYLCNFAALQDQCARCRLRIPMRFGKRSSPPEALLLLDPRLMSSSSSETEAGASHEKRDYEADSSASDRRVDNLNDQFLRILARSVGEDDNVNDDVISEGVADRMSTSEQRRIERSDETRNGRIPIAERRMRKFSTGGVGAAVVRQKRSPLSASAVANEFGTTATGVSPKSIVERQTTRIRRRRNDSPIVTSRHPVIAMPSLFYSRLYSSPSSDFKSPIGSSQ